MITKAERGLPDTAQSYRNEHEAGIAIQESGLSRSELFITTKYSGLNGLDIPTSIRNSIQNVRAENVSSQCNAG